MNTNQSARELALLLCGRPRNGLHVYVSAVISDRYGIFAWQINHKSPPSSVRLPSEKERWTVHAEEGALLRGNPKRMKGATLTVAGIRVKNGHWVFARPCVDVCLPLAKKRGIKKIEYTTKDGNWKEEYL